MSEQVQNNLAAEADAARERIAERLETLQDRLEPKKLVRETVTQARDAARQEVRHAAGVARDEIRRVTDVTTDFVRDNAAMLGVVAAAGVGIALAVNLSKRERRGYRTPTPLYDAYSMEDPTMHDEHNTSRLDRVRDSAAEMKARAGERYDGARERVSGAYGNARERAGELRQRAGETAEQYAARVKEQSTAAAQWAKRQPSESPMGTTAVAFAIGALVGALLPRSRFEDRQLGPTKAKLVDEVKTQADAALEAGKAALADAGVTTDAAKAKLAELTDQAKHVAKDVAGAAAEKVKVPSIGGQDGGQSQAQSGTGDYAKATGATAPTAAGTPGPAFTSGSAPVGGGTTQSGSTTDSASGYGTTPPAAGTTASSAF